jgi:hypothetical protein
VTCRYNLTLRATTCTVATVGFDRIRGQDQPSTTTGISQVRLSALFKNAKTQVDKARVVINASLNNLAQVLTMIISEIDDYSVDSLVGLKLRNRAVKEFGVEVAILVILSDTSIAGIGVLMVGKIC